MQSSCAQTTVSRGPLSVVCRILMLLHEKSRQAPTCGTPTPRSWVARMTKRSAPTGVGKSASRAGGTVEGDGVS